MKEIKLNEHFSFGKLIRFTLPPIVMMIFAGIYGVVDGLFVSNFAGKTAFAAVNLIMPVMMIGGCLGFMTGTGGSALVAKVLGQRDPERANRYFSMIIYFSIILGVLVTVIGYAILRPVSIALGAEGELLEGCIEYGKYLLIGGILFILEYTFQSFFIVAERPQYGLYVMLAAGITNMILDALFVGVAKWGLMGAALATDIAEAIGAIIPLIYFCSKKNKSQLHLVKTKFEFKPLLKTCTNGCSELMTNISMSLINMLYNVQLMKFAGEDGVAAYGVLMYVNFVFISLFIGYASGSAPIVSFNYGAQNHKELRNVLTKSLIFIFISGIAMVALAIGLAGPLAKLFVGYDQDLMAMTKRAFLICSVSFILTGFNIYGSSFFTALNNGVISAIISFVRTLVFQVIAVMVLPMLLGIDGIWVSVDIAEIMAIIMTISFIAAFRKKYHYSKAEANKEMEYFELTDEKMTEYKETIGKDVHVVMDRPIGTEHPKHPDIFYPINYGYIEGLLGGDGEEQDVYILGEDEPLKEWDGKVIAVVHRFDDNECKWVAAKEDTYSEEDIAKLIDFQECFHKSKIVK